MVKFSRYAVTAIPNGLFMHFFIVNNTLYHKNKHLSMVCDEIAVIK